MSDLGRVERAVELLLREMLGRPDLLVVTAIEHSDGSATLFVSTAPGDVGKLLGKQGRTAVSLRNILHAVSMNLGRTIKLDIELDGKPRSLHPGN